MSATEGRASARPVSDAAVDKERTRGSAPLRIGCVKYLNAQPLIHGWDGPVEFDHPAALCRKLADGELDVAFVSSFEFLRDPIYRIVDEVAVGSDGAVESVFLAHFGPLESVREIALDPASRTSVNLLRCLLAERGMNPEFLPPDETPDCAITATRARLLIGDQAIRFREEHGSAYSYRDLGAWWKEMTGLPFVFALWLIRPEVAEANQIADRLRALRDVNLVVLDRVIAGQDKFSADFCVHYFRDCLRYGFGEREKAGLLKFRALCEQHGLLPPNATPLRLI